MLKRPKLYGFLFVYIKLNMINVCVHIFIGNIQKLQSCSNFLSILPLIIREFFFLPFVSQSLKILSFIKRFCKKIQLMSCCNGNKACITRWKPFELDKITSNKPTAYTNSINPYGELSKVKCILAYV